MRELVDKIEQLNSLINKIENDTYKEVFTSITEILSNLSNKIDDINGRQEYLEENMEYIGDDLTDIQEELFEEVSFDDLTELEDEYVEINCDECKKPLFVEKQSLANNTSIPCPFCNGKAK